MKNTFVLFLLVLFSIPAFCQEKQILEIRSLYDSIQSEISEVQKEKAGAQIYCNELIINKFNGSWRATGHYLCTMRFWYNDQPQLADVDDPLSVLLKIELSYEWTLGNKEYIEYIFDKGKLVFAYVKEMSNAHADEPYETRWYWAEEKLIRYAEGKDIFEKMPSDELIKKDAKDLGVLFLATFN